MIAKRSDSLAQQVEHNTFNVGVLGSSPKRITKRKAKRRHQKEGTDGQKLVPNSFPRQIFQKRGTICRKLAQFNTKLEVNPKNWQAKTGKVSGRGAEFTRMNEMLDGIKATLYKHYQTILERDGYVTAEKVRNTFLGKECLPFFFMLWIK